MAAEAGVKINLDCYGCSPLTYALMQEDQSFVDKIIGLIHNEEKNEKNRVLRHCVTSLDLFKYKSKNLALLLEEML